MSRTPRQAPDLRTHREPPAERDRALAVVCPLSWCRAFHGEQCISRTHPGRPVDPHQHRLVAAGVITPPNLEETA